MRVDGERDGHAVGGDAVERLLHVEERVDRHADPAHLALGARVVGIEPELGRQVEGDVERVLAVGHEVLEARVRLRRRAEADVLAHRPHARAVHVGMDPAGERVLAGLAEVPAVVEPGHVVGPVHRLDLDPVEVRRVPELPVPPRLRHRPRPFPTRPPAGTTGSRTRSRAAACPSGRRRAPPSPAAPPHHAREWSPDDDRDVAGVGRPETLEEPAGQGQVGAREHRQADDVHVLLDGLGHQLVGRSLQSRVHDLDPRVTERVRHHLRTAVVPVQTRLRDQDLERSVAHGETGVKAGR